MKECPSCRVRVLVDAKACPLCHAALTESDGIPPLQAYPKPERVLRRRHLLIRLLAFLSLLGAVCCIMINELTDVSLRWWPYPVGAICYLWLATPTFFVRGQNPAGQIFWQAVLAQGFLSLLDALAGGIGWSIFAIWPALGCAVNVGIAVLMVVRRQWAPYALYQLFGVLFGLTPLVLHLAGVCKTLVLPLISAAFSLSSLFAVLMFGGDNVRQEFRRRFHF
ncbi:MAG: DUF6320 domain-containing protein [Oscillospiraceae bacterium]|nr:DUF6320 domain-containing protein [Oscillospiraceae bacterium]